MAQENAVISKLNVKFEGGENAIMEKGQEKYW